DLACQKWSTLTIKVGLLFICCTEAFEHGLGAKRIVLFFESNKALQKHAVVICAIRFPLDQPALILHALDRILNTEDLRQAPKRMYIVGIQGQQALMVANGVSGSIEWSFEQPGEPSADCELPLCFEGSTTIERGFE